MFKLTRRNWLASACGALSGLSGCGRDRAADPAVAPAGPEDQNGRGKNEEATSRPASLGPGSYVLEPLPRAFKGPGFAAAFNRHGQVAGQFTTQARHNHACRWDTGTFQDLDRPEGLWSAARAMNRHGHVVGEHVAGPDQVIHGFLWRDGSFKDLGTLGGPESRALGINDAGLIAGYARDAAGLAHAVVWEHGKLRPLGGRSPEFPRSQALALNEAGVVVGSVHGDRGGHAMIWDDSRVERLHPPREARSSVASAISSEGEVAGSITVEAGRHSHACVWRRGHPEILHGLGFASTATAINALGQVGGSYFRDKGEQRAFLALGKRMHDLTGLLKDAGGLILRSVQMIDDRAWIAGVAEQKGLPVPFIARPL
jgi:probable HAF family extracellular repeat protein